MDTHPCSLGSFLTSSKHVYTTWGRALAKSLSTLTKPTRSEQEAYLTAFELIRFGVLTAHPYSKTYEKHRGEGNIVDRYSILYGSDTDAHIFIPADKQQHHITLIARTLSLLPMEFKVNGH
jgi:ABC-type enterochelin transport system ATPase subunit